MQSFTKKDRFKDLMARIPIHLIATRTSLVEAATYGLESLKNIKRAA
jgi:glucokinase